MKVIECTIEMEPINKILAKRGLETKGRAQRFFTSEVLRHSKPYTPRRNTILLRHVVQGPDYIEYITPYAQYLWYGMLMLAKNGSSYAKKGEAKTLTDIDLKYNGDPKRGKMWVNRMWKDKKDVILKSVASYVGGRAIK